MTSNVEKVREALSQLDSTFAEPALAALSALEDELRELRVERDQLAIEIQHVQAVSDNWRARALQGDDDG